jgi:penicillin-binding protein 2
MNAEVSYRIRLSAFVALFVFLLLAARLWQLQILRGEEFRRISNLNRVRIVKLPAPRGIIYDRNSIPLVKNSPYYSVAVLQEMLNSANLDAIAAYLGMDREELDRRIKEHVDPFEPIVLKGGLTFEEVAYIDARRSDYPALTIHVEETRHYLYGEVGAHLIGYLGKLTSSQVESTGYKDIPRESFIGQWGVEKLYDETLRGTPGQRVIEVDALGRQLRILHEEPPEKGSDLYLSMDINLQKAAEEAFGERAGALVALKPTTGEVLGLVSKPSFDPNLFSRGISYQDWLTLVNHEGNPMLNRALQSQYPPGSTFKIITAAAALEEGAITPATRVTCTGGIKLGRWTFGCWKHGGHGTLSLHRALVESCDVYFYLAGGETDIDNIAKYARRFGLGSKTGIPLATEKTGLVPDRQWKKKVKNDSWYLGETYNAAIGQGYVLATPAQMARLMSAVSNGGHLYDAVLLRAEHQPEPSSDVGVKEGTLRVIREALKGVVNEPHGTGYAARSPVVEIGGKTGTAQVISDKSRERMHGKQLAAFKDHAWFVAFAPTDKPEIALSVFVEHGGHGGEAAAPIARKAIEAYMSSTEARNEAQ